MTDISTNRVFIQFEEWLEQNVTAGADGRRRVSVEQLHEFLSSRVLNDSDTVAVDGARISLLWSYLIGPRQEDDDWDNNKLAQDLAERASEPLRFIGNTLAGEFLAFLDSAAGELGYLAFGREDSNTTPDSDVLSSERMFNQFWHKLSEFFVQETSGPLVTITPKGSITTIFAEDEIPELVNNDAIASINGVERSELGIDIFANGSMAQIAYLLAVVNGEFAGDLLRKGTAQVIAVTDPITNEVTYHRNDFIWKFCTP